MSIEYKVVFIKYTDTDCSWNSRTHRELNFHIEVVLVFMIKIISITHM